MTDSALVNTKGTNIKNLSTAGNFYIAEGVGEGDVTISGATVGGTLFIRGGGSQSVHLEGGNFNAIVMNSRENTHLDLSEQTKVERIYLNASASVVHGTVSLVYDVDAGKLTFAGTIDQVTLNADGSAKVTANGMVYDVIPIYLANRPKTTFVISAGATVKDMVLHGPVNIGGTGTIDKMEVHADGVVIDEEVDIDLKDITVDEGVVLTIGDKEYVGTGDPLTPETPSPDIPFGSGKRRVPVTSVSLSSKTLALAIDEEGADTLALTATVLPENATNQEIAWHSENTEVAVVDGLGNVTAVAEGQTTITVTTADGGHQASAEVDVLGAIDFIEEKPYLSAYASYNPYEGKIYLDWASNTPDGTFLIYSGVDAEQLDLLQSLTGVYSHEIDAADVAQTLYFQVKQVVSEELTLESGVMELVFDSEGLFVPDEEDPIALEVETNPFLIDTDKDGLSDGMEDFLSGQGYEFDSADPHSFTGDESILDGDALVDYICYLEQPPQDYRVWLSLTLPASLIELLSLEDISQSNGFFGDSIYGYIGAPAVQINFPKELFDKLSNIKLVCEISGGAAQELSDSEPEFTYFNEETQMFEDVAAQEFSDAGDVVKLTANLEHFSYYTVVDKEEIGEYPELDPDFTEEDFKEQFNRYDDNNTDVVFLVPTPEDPNGLTWYSQWTEPGEYAPVDIVREFADYFGENLNCVALSTRKCAANFVPETMEGDRLPLFEQANPAGILRPGAINPGLAPSGSPVLPFHDEFLTAMSIYFDDDYLPYKSGVAEKMPQFRFRYIDESYKSESPIRAMVMIMREDQIYGLKADHQSWTDQYSDRWNWNQSAATGNEDMGGLRHVAPKDFADQLDVKLYLIAYREQGHESLEQGWQDLLKTYQGAGDNYPKTYHAKTDEQLQQILLEIATDLGTIDVTTDSNDDGISDYFTKQICRGVIRLGTGAQLRDDNGNLPSYERFQNNDDYDGDGIPNTDELTLVFDKNGNPFLQMTSNPFMKDTNGNQIIDSDDPYPLTAWQPTTAIANIVKEAGFIYLEEGVNYRGEKTGDFLYARIDAHQKDLGYCYSYDESIVAVSSAILCEPIYFYYDGKEWLIEMWKGQYGIETGAEIGVYNRESGTSVLGDRVAANISKMLQKQVKSIFGNSVAGDLFNKVLEPIYAIAKATPDTLVRMIDAAISVVRSNAVYGPLKLLLGQGRVEKIIQALLTARNYINCKIYDCVGPDEYLEMSIKLTNEKGEVLFERNNTDHWWLTGFKWGEFTPDLGAIACDIEITFPNMEMQYAFLNGLPPESSADYRNNIETYEKMMASTPQNLKDNNNDNDRLLGMESRGYYKDRADGYRLDGNKVSFTFREAKTTQPFASVLNPAVLAYNRILVSAYNALLYVLDLDTTDPNAIENKLLNLDQYFDEAMFNRYKSAFGNAVPFSLRNASYSSALVSQVQQQLNASKDTVFNIIEVVSNMLFTIAKDVVGPPS